MRGKGTIITGRELLECLKGTIKEGRELLEMEGYYYKGKGAIR